MFYEIVYETGRVSVAEYADDAEAQKALGEQHRRATSGEPGGPVGQPAERIRSVFKYANHPNEFNAEQTMSADVLNKEVTNLIKTLADDNGVVAIDQLAVEVRGVSHPMVANADRESFDSMFKMKEDSKLDLAFLEA